ncbi:DUF6458 family protein [Miltoncostaea oceani]|uniref:DUF6458 family protein n=1 Tax=Miltoncostaea oceani TaxID=2843216 RepID=UPI001C3DF24B|nr:DUF6458 family protein [Miltoncostaea oceani]
MAPLGIILIIIGAVLRFGLTTAVEGARLDVIGLILMIAGVVALMAGVLTSERFSRTKTRERTEEGPNGSERVTETKRGL